jgi:serine protease
MNSMKLLSAAVLGASLALASQSGIAAEQGRYVVTFKGGQSQNGKKSLRSAGATLKRDLRKHNAASVAIDADGAAALAKMPGIARVEPDPRRWVFGTASRTLPSGADRAPADHAPAGQAVPYGIAMVQAEGYAGDLANAPKVCVIDSGYDLGHEDKPGADVVTGSDDLAGAGPWDQDGSGHGSHVSGTINALDNGVGVIGVFPNAPMHVVRVFGDDGIWAYSSDLVAALDDCVAAGAKVVNMSLGGPDPSQLENNAFLKANKAGVLSIAAAGNDGNGKGAVCADYGPRQACKMHYPAAYQSVMSVAAVDSNMNAAGFSQRNSQVEIAGPGVSVLSTVPTGSMLDVILASGLGNTDVEPMDNFEIPTDPVAGNLQDCGLGTVPGDCGDATGKICLIERGAVTFAEKALACEAAGGAAAVVFNRAGEVGPVLGTLGETHVSIPVVGMDRDSGLALRATWLGTSATLSFSPSHYDYDYFSGTSMATPHVAGVAALVWSTHPQCSNNEVRAALNATAVDLGVPGRDHTYGNGLVQAQAASDYLDQHGCAGN